MTTKKEAPESKKQEERPQGTEAKQYDNVEEILSGLKAAIGPVPVGGLNSPSGQVIQEITNLIEETYKIRHELQSRLKFVSKEYKIGVSFNIRNMDATLMSGLIYVREHIKHLNEIERSLIKGLEV